MCFDWYFILCMFIGTGKKNSFFFPFFFLFPFYSFSFFFLSFFLSFFVNLEVQAFSLMCKCSPCCQHFLREGSEEDSLKPLCISLGENIFQSGTVVQSNLHYKLVSASDSFGTTVFIGPPVPSQLALKKTQFRNYGIHLSSCSKPTSPKKNVVSELRYSFVPLFQANQP